jgi:hypothetical protein
MLPSGQRNEERKPIQALVKARMVYEDMVAQLVHELVDLVLGPSGAGCTVQTQPT